MVLIYIGITGAILGCVALGFIMLTLIDGTFDNYQNNIKTRKQLLEERKQRLIERSDDSLKHHSGSISDAEYITYDMLKGIIGGFFPRSEKTRQNLTELIRTYVFIDIDSGYPFDKMKQVRFKNPFIINDDEKIDLIRSHYKQSFIELLLYGFQQQPSEYLKKQVNKLKLTIGLPEQDYYVESEQYMQEIELNEEQFNKVYKINKKFLGEL
ncbi:hypothetical protein PBI_SCTP2_430 [Salicola phage SCTP-2]|nr:hypothetical protein PBI_SCTP2_430 [Salicola phage SCTP-2]